MHFCQVTGEEARSSCRQVGWEFPGHPLLLPIQLSLLQPRAVEITSGNMALLCERGPSPLPGVSMFQSENGDGKQEAEVAGALAYLGPESMVLTEGGRGLHISK